ncbi:cation transporter [filamentous cyanobacterium CCP2]|nr:cation transporter [filamentous cyanobacterium CCP2]
MYHNCHAGCFHSHTVSPSTHKTRSLWIALILIICLAGVEGSVGWISHSLALVAESGHMVSDGLALGVALLASWMARFPASEQATFGYRRIEILAALANGVGLLLVAGWIGWEALNRLGSPPDEILSIPMLVTAIIGFIINSVNAFLLHDGSQQDLNLRGAFLHMVADAVSAVGVIVAAIVVWQFHWNWADSVTSLGVAIFIALGAIPLVRQSLHILLEKTPIHLDPQQIQAHLSGYEGVEAVQQLRIWSIALGQDALLAHLTVSIPSGEGRDRLLHQIETSLQQEFGIQEIFLQLTAPVALPLINLSQPQTLELLNEQVGRKVL